MNAKEAIEYIHSISWTFCKPGLDRIKILCRELGDPQDSLRFIHVAGTNGKGSFCSMIDSVLRNAGYKTGLFTSPYIRHFNERICFDGGPISDGDLAEITEYVSHIADIMEEKPTEFELITAIGFEYFKRKGADVVILEAGMGGRLDSTNIIRDPILSVITGIALDHTAFLGDTVEKIAYEKAGIIKDGRPVLFGGDDESAYAVIKSVASERGSLIYRTDRSALKDISATLEGTEFTFKDRQGLRIGLLGLYQPLNAANVLTAIDIIKEDGFKISEKNIKKGLLDAVWHARFELLSNDPPIIYDGAHNPEGISAAVRSIKEYFGDKKVFVLSGVMKDKDYSFIAAELASVASRAFTVTPDNPRSLSAKEYASVLEKTGVDALPFDSLKEALSAAVSAAKETNTPLVCLGSLYMYAELIKIFKELS